MKSSLGSFFYLINLKRAAPDQLRSSAYELPDNNIQKPAK